MLRDLRSGSLWKPLFLLALLPLLCHCEKTPASKPLDKVDFQLQWVHQGEFAWAYLAKEEGLFTAQGLDVSLHPAGPGIDRIAGVLDGSKQFGTLPVDTLFGHREKGDPLVILAVIYQRSPVSFISLKSANLISPTDFVGKNVTFSSHSDRAQFMTMLSKLNLPTADIAERDYSYKYAGLLDGSVDISGAYAVGGVLRLKERGIDLNVCWPHDYGVRFYGEALVAREDFVSANPELTRRVVRAMVNSLQKTIAEPQVALAATMKYAKEKNEILQSLMIRTSLPLIAPGDSPLGSIDPEKLAEMNRILYEQQVLKSPDVWQKSYNDSFLPGSGKG